MPPNARLSWLAFDHYYSDLAFESGFAAIATRNHQRILDIGGNTGRFARRCVASDNTLRVTIADLPGQLTLAQHEVAHAPGAERITTHGIDLLDESSQLPIGHDAIWMSQFLDCFGEAQIISILRRCRTAIAKNGRVYILEPLWDRQKDVMAAFCLQQTSLYFAAIANGTSRIYTSDVMLELIQRAGLEIESIIEPIGIVHSLLVCKVADAVT